MKIKFRGIMIIALALLIFDCATRPLPQIERGAISIIAVGDNLIHKELIETAEDGRSFNFAPYYRGVREAVRRADVAFINQETLIAGAEFGYAGYPLFNGPREIGDALISTGFNVINHASNHSMDKGEDAVFAVMDYWKNKRGITVLGIHRSPEERAKPSVINVKGVKIGFLSYTYGLNGQKLPADKPWLVSLIDKSQMELEINALRPMCDFLIVSMHWGKEYEHKPSAQQEELAGFLAANKVDLVIGHHPHVLQPVKKIEREDGGETLVFFSLGNFISAQNETPRALGGMMTVILEKTDGTPIIARYELIPLVTHYERISGDGTSAPSVLRGFRVEFLENYDDKSAANHALNNPKRPLSILYFKKLFDDIVN